VADHNDIPPIPLPPGAGAIPPVEPPPVTPPVPPAAPATPPPPAAAGPVAPAPLPPVAQPARPDPYAQPGTTPQYAPPGSAPPAYGAQGYAYAPAAAAPPQGLALGSMITGIGAVLLSFAGVGLPPAVAAVILGHVAQRRQPYARPLWLTGLITGYVALGISLIWVLFVVVAIIVGIASDSYY
jgi:hypothetical protein